MADDLKTSYKLVEGTVVLKDDPASSMLTARSVPLALRTLAVFSLLGLGVVLWPRPVRACLQYGGLVPDFGALLQNFGRLPFTIPVTMHNDNYWGASLTDFDVQVAFSR